MKSYKEIAEALKGNQHKIDKNKNGKIDAHDFKLLRKEESELTEATVKTQKYSWGTMKTVHHGADFSIPLHPEHHQAIAKLKDNQEHKFKDETGRHWTAKRMGDDVHFQGANNGGTTKVKHADLKEAVEDEDRMTRSDYKASPSGRKSHKEIVFKHGESDKKELDEVAPPGFEGTVKAMKKKKEIDNPYALAWSMYKKGYKSHKNPDGTMKEEVEELDERNKENALKRKSMDASRGARFKAQGNYVPDPEPEHKTAQAHNKAIGRAIRQMSNEEVEHLTEGMKTTHEDPLVTVHDKDGLHTHANLSTANNIFGTKVKHTDVHKGPVTVTSGRKSDNNGKLKFAISQHHAQAVKDEEKFRKQFGEQAPVAPVPDRKYIKGTPEHKAYKASKKPRTGMPTNVKEEDEVTYSQISFAEFMEGMTATQVRPGVTRYTGGSYGNAKGAKYGNTDYDKEDIDKKDDEEQQKRGRGRPAGSKSGARGPRIK